jgi:hypothetical protein
VSALFPRWTDHVVRPSLVVVFGGLVAAPVALMVWVRTPYVTGQYNPRDQPVLFDHRHHVRDDGVGCEYCHYTARRSPFAGVPPTALCMGCHSQIWNDSPLLEPVRRSYFTGEPLRWRRVNALPDHVYFDHAAHVTRGVGCASCHGRVDLMAQVYQVAPLTMAWCLDCHRDPEPHLRPLDAVADMAWRPARPAREVGREVRAALHVAPPTDCTACHR